MAETTFGPAWQGWESYRQFSESVKTQFRFAWPKQVDEFLREVLGSHQSRVVKIPNERIFWRARLGCEQEEVLQDHEDIQVSYLEDRPFGPAGMKPIRNWQVEGRANPKGIPCLYLATTPETALAEVRPWIGAPISVATLRATRDLTVVDCSKNHSDDSFFSIIDSERSREDGIWTAIDRAFAAPVSKDEEARDYVPTQIIAELFKREGLDGIVYKSLLSEDGFNLALFDLDGAEVTSCELMKAASIAFKFDHAGSQYFVGTGTSQRRDIR